MASYVNAHRAPVDVSSGRMLAPGESIPAGQLDLDGAHDKRLVDEGLLIQQDEKRPSRAKEAN